LDRTKQVPRTVPVSRHLAEAPRRIQTRRAGQELNFNETKYTMDLKLSFE
jgi:hypothetical protein